MKRVLKTLKPHAEDTFWHFVGFCVLGLGFLGVALPVLPTTPFVILAAFAFGKSSPRLQAYLENNKVFGPIIADWQENGAIATRFKIVSIVMMVGAFALSVGRSAPVPVLFVQAACMTLSAAFILSRPARPIPSKSQATASQ